VEGVVVLDGRRRWLNRSMNGWSIRKHSARLR
jgi:hypothetical protein